MPISQTLQSEVSRGYNSFSGTDMRCLIGPRVFAELQGIQYAISREKAPIYTMGSPDPRAFSRNKRGVSGTLVWLAFDRHALLGIVRDLQGKFVANRDDIRPQYANSNVQYLGQTAIFNTALSRNVSIPVGSTVDQVGLATSPTTSVSGFKEQAAPWYSDQILPFDITLIGTNELGAATTMKIYGVDLLNEGYGISVDDAVSEMQATFVARGVEPLQAVASNFPQFGPAGTLGPTA